MVKIIGPLASHHASGTITAPKISSISLRNRHARIAPEAPPTPPPPPPDYIVTGEVNPDITGNYYESAPRLGCPTYTRDDGLFAIWAARWIMFNEWNISNAPGDLSGAYWKTPRENCEDIEAFYTPQNSATGIAFVHAPP